MWSGRPTGNLLPAEHGAASRFTEFAKQMEGPLIAGAGRQGPIVRTGVARVEGNSGRDCDEFDGAAAGPPSILPEVLRPAGGSKIRRAERRYGGPATKAAPAQEKTVCL